MKTTFIGKPEPKEPMPQDEFTIEKAVEIDADLFARFIRNPLDDYGFIEENEGMMFVDENEVWHRILVNSEGSGYARYASAVPLVLLEGE